MFETLFFGPGRSSELNYSEQPFTDIIALTVELFHCKADYNMQSFDCEINNLIERWRRRARRLKIDIYAVYLAYKHPRTPWPAKALALFVVDYAVSPIDLIPDFIRALGYVDDLLLLPLGIMLAVKLIPPAVYDECKAKALRTDFKDMPFKWIGALAVVIIWITGGFFIVRQVLRIFAI